RRGAAYRQRAGGAGDPRQPAALFQLADLPPAVHPRRADRRLRHHHGAVRIRRAGPHGRGSPEGVSATAATAGGARSGALRDRVVLVSGAHGGLGRAAALACARAGATVVLLGRKVPKLNRVYDAIARSDEGLPEPVNYPFDLEGASPDDHAELAQRVSDGFGRLDGLLHCAADFHGLTSFERSDPARFARAIHVNLTARAWLTQACLPLLRKAPDSAVVFAIDDLARVGGAYWGGYGLAQHATAALVGMLHAELANSTVRVSGL